MHKLAPSSGSQAADPTPGSPPLPSQPLISVLIPLYNHENYILAGLDSILADGYPEVEVVILDDGSRDESLRLAQQWQERHSDSLRGRIVIRSRENRGVTRTVNELVAMAQGEFVAFLASDDLLLPGSLESRLDYLREHPEKMAVFGDSVVVDKDGRQLHDSALDHLSQPRKYYRGSIRRLLAEAELLPYELIFNWSVPGPGFMARRELYRIVGGYDESLKVEDWDFYLRLAARRVLGYLDRTVAAYRIHGLNSASSPASCLRQSQDLLQTARKNSSEFSGVKRLHLYALIFKYKADINNLEGHKRKSKFFYRVHIVIRWLTTRIYGMKIRRFS